MISAYSEGVAMLFEAVSGQIIDTKLAIILATTMMGVSLVLVPFFIQLYPGFFLVYVIMSIGSIICLNNPLLPDYVHKGSFGLAQSYNQIIDILAMVVSTSGLFALHNLITDQKYIYFGVSAIFLSISLFNCFAIKDVVTEQKA